MAIAIIQLTNTFDEWRIAFNDSANVVNAQLDSTVLATLTTNNKTTLVGAINEINGNAGDLSTLTTTDKTSLVNAINEINGNVSGFASLSVNNIFTESQTIDKSGATAVWSIGSTLNTGEVARIEGLGENSVATKLVYGSVGVEITDNTQTSEDGIVTISSRVAGTLAKRFNVGDGLYAEGVSGGDMGAGTGNFTALYVNGLPVNAGGTMVVDNFADGIDFTSGTTTSLSLSTDPGSENNIEVVFDGVYQHHNTFSVAGTTLTFDAPIPLDVQNVQVRIGSTVSIGVPSANSVGDVELQATGVTPGSYTNPQITVDENGRITTATSGSAIVFDTPQTTTSGNSVLFNAISSTAKKITIVGEGITVDTSSVSLYCQIGTTSGIETTGYTSGSAGGVPGNVLTGGSSTTSFLILDSVIVLSGSDMSFHLTLTKIDATSNTWVIGGSAMRATNAVYTVNGFKTLADVITQLQIAISGGNFVTGTINLLYE